MCSICKEILPYLYQQCGGLCGFLHIFLLYPPIQFKYWSMVWDTAALEGRASGGWQAVQDACPNTVTPAHICLVAGALLAGASWLVRAENFAHKVAAAQSVVLRTERALAAMRQQVCSQLCSAFDDWGRQCRPQVSALLCRICMKTLHKLHNLAKSLTIDTCTHMPLPILMRFLRLRLLTNLLL